MLQTQKPNSPKGKYFADRADSCRRQLDAAELELKKYEAWAAQDKAAGREMSLQVEQNLRYWREQVRYIRNDMDRALFQAGRL